MALKKDAPAAAADAGTRQRMIEATARQLQRHGYAATSWRGVVEEAGTPWGSAYHHFPGGKEQLAAAGIAFGSLHVVDMLRTCLGDDRSVPDAVRAWFALTAENLTSSQFRGGCPIATVALETTPTSAVLTEACSTAFGRWREILAEAIVAAGAEPDRAADLATLVVLNLEGALLLARVGQNVAPLHLAGNAMGALLDSALPGNRRLN